MWEISLLLKLLSVLISGIAAPLLVWWVKESYGEEENKTKPTLRKKNGSTSFSYRSKKIIEELRDIRSQLKADRIWICQFHNGGKYVDSIKMSAMKKMSIKYEVTDKGISEEKDKIKNILISFFSELILKVMEEGYVNYKKNKKTEPEIELLFRQRGNEEMHFFSIKNIDDILIGILCVDYVNRKRRLSAEEIQYLNAETNLIAGHMNKRENK